MSIKLFEHNKTAYNQALDMLNETGKAAVVHPTGAGKSFIGFRLCEGFPDKTICWLSPSEYIFKTQLENLADAADGWQPENIKFFTYAKLMLMNEAELAEITPDYIVLDEFHRCGAEMWGAGVDNLIALYPDVPLLGLSATAIRYLDNQRNMVEELFDGNIASEMTLGEAIVRGILNPPKYVISMFAYQEDYKKIESRVRSTKTKATRDKAEKYLEALRRALEMADGMDVIFDKHITDRTGKYIVFCSNIDHLREMQSNVANWFYKIDKEPHIYTAYSLDTTTEKEFEDFKKDKSDHLKLLFCIDMLNEGVHVENVSGVILFRPTVSPIIYKQQIGRALSASKTKNPIIFDIVNNIENLYSIGTIEQEMRLAISYYRDRGESNYIVNEYFQVIDEVRDAKELFDSLNDTLSLSWQDMFAYAEIYFRQHGHLEVPVNYKTKDGYTLGRWVQTQRKVYHGKVNGNLDEEKIKKLESIGMNWNSYKDTTFERNYVALKAFYEANGHLKVPHGYVTEDGIRLGDFVIRLRAYRKMGSNSSYISPDRIRMLDEIDMIWDVPGAIWEKYYAALREYYDTYGNIEIPSDYKLDDGTNLGKWLRQIKSIYRNPAKKQKLDAELIELLESMNIDWRTSNEIAWWKGYKSACAYYEHNKTWSIPNRYVSGDGVSLQVWIQNQRTNYANGRMSQEHIDLLNKVNFVWELRTPDKTWDRFFSIAESYYALHGNLEIKRREKYQGVLLGQWLQTQRKIRDGRVKGKSLTAEQIRKLDSIGMRWSGKKETVWIKRLDEARHFVDTHGALNPSSRSDDPNERSVRTWLTIQRRRLREGKLTDEQIQMLQGLKGFSVSEALQSGRSA